MDSSRLAMLRDAVERPLIELGRAISSIPSQWLLIGERIDPQEVPVLGERRWGYHLAGFCLYCASVAPDMKRNFVGRSPCKTRGGAF